jgi:FkbM family methyltransferase
MTRSSMRAVSRRLINSRLGQTVKPRLSKALGQFGFELTAINRDDRHHLQSTLQRLSISSIFDIGANQGQFGTLLRHLGYSGDILSLEPMKRAFNVLEAQARLDPRWLACNTAISSKPGTVALNVTRNSTSSSLLDSTRLHVDAEPTSEVLRTEMVPCRTLDEVSIAYQLKPPYFLKIDVQGSEMDVLDGGRVTLARTSGVRVETSLRELYEGAPTIGPVLSRLDREGFVPTGMVSAFQDFRTGDTLQVDIVACRKELVES